MIYFYTLILTIIAFSAGYDYFFYYAYNKGLIFAPSQHKQPLMKFVLSAFIKAFLPIKILIAVLSVIFVALILLLQIQILISWWTAIFINVFNSLYSVGYLYPKIKRIIHWDYKNPVTRWEELYKNYNKSSKILVIISFVSLVVNLISYFYYLLKLV